MLSTMPEPPCAKRWLTEERVRFLKYCIVGGSNTAAMYVLYLGLLRIGLPYAAALTADYVVGVLLTFTLQREWTFRSRGDKRRQFAKYVASYVPFFAINLGVLAAAVELAAMDERWAQIPAIVVAYSVTYFLHRFWVFDDHGH